MTARGKIVLTLLVLAVVGVGVGQWRDDLASGRRESRSVWTAVALAPLSPEFEPGRALTAAAKAPLKTAHSKRFATAKPTSDLEGSLTSDARLTLEYDLEDL